MGFLQSFMSRLIRWMGLDRRIASRHQKPPIFARLGTVHSERKYQIGDIGIRGFYMISEDRWNLGTVVPVTLERTDDNRSDSSFAINATVVRIGNDGIGFSFNQRVV